MRHSRFVIACRQASPAKKIMKVRQTRMSRRKQQSHGRHLFRPGQYKKLVTLLDHEARAVERNPAKSVRPASIPTARNSSSAGTPNRLDALLDVAGLKTNVNVALVWSVGPTAPLSLFKRSTDRD